MRRIHRKRLASTALAAFLLLAVLSTFCLSLAHVRHDCRRVDCPACTAIRAGEEFLRALGCLTALAALAALLPQIRAFFSGAFATGRAPSTLVHLKVKLTN